MAKRFTDSNKYKKPFIRALPGAYKLLWDYLYHDCDHAGIWIVDFEIAQLYIGSDMPVSEKKALEIFNKNEVRIIEFDGGKKWFLPGFIDFQYGELKENNRLHLSVIHILDKNNLYKNKALTSPLQGAKDKYKDKDKEQYKDKEEVGIEKIETWPTEKEKFLQDGKWIYRFCTEKNIPLAEFDARAKEFLADLELKEDYKPIKQIRSHFTNWFNLQKKQNGKSLNQTSSGNRKASGAEKFLQRTKEKFNSGGNESS